MFRFGETNNLFLGVVARPNLSEAYLLDDLELSTFPVLSYQFVVLNPPTVQPADAPRIAGVSLLAESIIDGGVFDVEIEFTEPVALIGFDDRMVRMQDQDRTSRSFNAVAFALDETGTRLLAEFSDIPDGRYWLTVEDILPSGSFRDADGNLLDGDSPGDETTLPSGDGVPGGPFRLPLFVDVDETSFAGSFSSAEDSLEMAQVSDPMSGYLTSGNTDELLFDLQAGQVISLDVAAEADVRLAWMSPDSFSDPVISRGTFGPFTVDTSGTYRLFVGYAGENTPYDVRLLAGIVREAEFDGAGPNNDGATAQPIPVAAPGIQPRVTTVLGSLSENDEDWYRFPINAGSNVSFRLGKYERRPGTAVESVAAACKCGGRSESNRDHAARRAGQPGGQFEDERRRANRQPPRSGDTIRELDINGRSSCWSGG